MTAGTMRKIVGTVMAMGAVVALASCGVGRGDDEAGRSPLPGNVPAGPRHATADEIVGALDAAGIKCAVVRRDQGDGSGGSGATCQAKVNGAMFENEIHTLSPKVFSRDDLGAAVASRRKPPYSHTLVVAGNWFVRVREPRFAPQVAKALHGVVLPPEKVKVPDYPLPSIPAEPRYKSLGALADALDKAVGCAERSEGLGGTMTCTTGKRIGRSPNCATLALHDTAAARDRTLREAIAYKGVPATLVTAGNWTVNLCDYGLGSRVAQALDGRVVAYDGQ
ncbi:hypothetical protein [Streptomyces sp. I05A-00742]|uniref:hypothetical protein n=1 Tax=Streptomyces sp. I05A-00742 TaxID=2732853 RepID=UPI001BB19C8E|nr:hypothetical protein [Streptomyces sp. I05A-00742]